MLGVNVQEIKEYIDSSGMKQKAVAERAGLDECKLSLSLLGKRKLEAGEYAGICMALGVPMDKFLRPRALEEKGE